MTLQHVPRIGAATRSGKRTARLLILAVIAGGIGLLLWKQRPEPAADPPVPARELTPFAGPGEPGQTTDTLAPARELMRQGDFEGALRITDAVVLERPDDVEALLLHGEVLFRLYRSEEMIPHLEHALTLQPDRFEAHANLAFALRFAGRLDDAEREAQWCLERQPEHTAVRRVLAEIRRDQGDHAAALAEVRAALRAAPQDLECRLLEADLLLFARDSEAAWQGLLPLQQEHGRNARYLSALIRAAQMSGRAAEAAEYRAAMQRLNEGK